MPSIYVDHASTTPMDPAVLRVLAESLERDYGNPMASHSRGRRARAALEGAREEVARLVGCLSEEVVFTSSATEANNLAVKGIFRAMGRRSSRILVSAIEHVSVLHAAAALSDEGAKLVKIQVDPQGRLDLGHLAAELADGASLVSVMHGNPEVGTIQNVEEAIRIARRAGALIHCDATLTAGLYPDLWRALDPDLMTLAPHLFHGPKGIAALIVRTATRIRPQIEGGIQEGGLRAGTPNVALAAGFGEAARLAREAAPHRAAFLQSLAQQLSRRIEESLQDVVPTGDPVRRMPGHLSLCLRYVEGEAVVSGLDDAGIEAGSGSACTLGAGKTSHVLQAMGLDPVLARGSVELCFGAFNRPEDVQEVTTALGEVVGRLRELSPLTPTPRRRA